MSERDYLGIVHIHGHIEIVRASNLERLQIQTEGILEKPKKDYPNYDFDSQIEIYNVRLLRRKEKKAWLALQ